ncbi:RAS small monomeric GTPase [Purpureocillium lavendulum]|uniref:RAS small monomeric GTPase n=1 Tax=Purpureocillium lavendulum TaxID=1247861 RepID=A0AB34FQ80_9HYPO|nr:RAS small monomeric GTPase [Purpureocillium lavendulum]
MCTEKRIFLACQHHATTCQPCSKMPSDGPPTSCVNFTRETVESPSSSGSSTSSNSSSAVPPPCPLLPNCPYSLRDGRWNCCECGKVMNTAARFDVTSRRTEPCNDTEFGDTRQGRTECPLEHCAFKSKGGRWVCCQCRQGPNTGGWCLQPVKRLGSSKGSVEDGEVVDGEAVVEKTTMTPTGTMVAPSLTPTFQTSDSAQAEIRDIALGLDRMENKALSSQRVVLSDEKTDNMSKLALGAKLERALDRRMSGQDAVMRPRQKSIKVSISEKTPISEKA